MSIWERVRGFLIRGRSRDPDVARQGAERKVSKAAVAYCKATVKYHEAFLSGSPREALAGLAKIQARLLGRLMSSVSTAEPLIDRDSLIALVPLGVVIGALPSPRDLGLGAVDPELPRLAQRVLEQVTGAKLGACRDDWEKWWDENKARFHQAK